MKTAALRKVSYDPSIFDVETIDEAMRVIVTPEAGMTTEYRWDRETSYLISLIEKHCRPTNSIVLDYGCGIGRLAKPLIDKHRCEVVGVDISANMRALAVSLCGDNFIAIQPMRAVVYLKENRCGLALAVWTLQHVLDVRHGLSEIDTMLRPGGKLFVVNNIGRVVPTTGGWVNDGVDVRAVLQDHFTELERGQLPDDIAPAGFKDATFWAIYQK